MACTVVFTCRGIASQQTPKIAHLRGVKNKLAQAEKDRLGSEPVLTKLNSVIYHSF